MDTSLARFHHFRPLNRACPWICDPIALMRVLLVLCLVSVGMGSVLQGQNTAPAIQTIQIQEDSITLQVGETKTVKVNVLPAQAGRRSLRYESGNRGFFTVNNQGVLTGVHEGSSVLAVIAPNGVRAEVNVQVVVGTAGATGVVATPLATQGIIIGNAGGTIEVGRSERIIAHLLPHQPIGGNPFTLSSSNPSVLRVIDAAKVIEAVGEGSATVTASTLDGRFQSSVQYTVVPVREEHHSDEKTYRIEPQRFGIRYDDASEEAAKANSAGLYQALLHTGENGYTRLLLEAGKVFYVEPKDTIHMVSNVQLDLNGSEIKLRPNDYPRYTTFLFAEHKDRKRILENASMVNGTLTGERDHKGEYFPNWSRTPATEGACTIVFGEGRNNGIRHLTVRKSIGFNIAARTGRNAHGVLRFANHPVRSSNLEFGGYDAKGAPIESEALMRTKQPIDISAFATPYYTLGLPVGYVGYPFVQSRIYDAWFYDKEMNLLAVTRGNIRFRQYALPAGTAQVHLVYPRFLHGDAFMAGLPTGGTRDFHEAVMFFENSAPPINNYIIDCVIEDNFSTGMAACGGQGWLIKNNIFRRNGGRMPGCDIDWEDGWEYMQNDLIIGNTFESRVNVITCAGVGLVFRDNTFHGNNIFYGRTQHYSLLNNVFAKKEDEKAFPVNVRLESQTDAYLTGNRFINASVTYTRQHAKAPYFGTYDAVFTGNHFDGSTTLRGNGMQLHDNTFTNGAKHVE